MSKLSERLRQLGRVADDNALAAAAALDACERALCDLLERYTGLVNCGDCGNWDPEKENEVISARAALVKLGVAK